jgi:hypothetical protein
MKDVHIFQRFSKKEDVVTNNTLLLFKWLQHQNARLFEQILRLLICGDDDELIIGAVLTEQERAKSGRIADGVIRQQSFHIVLETKLHGSFDVKQLRGHLDAFKSPKEGLEVLLLLGKQESDDVSAAKRAIAKFNARYNKSVRLAWTTFAKVLETCREVVPEHDLMITETLDDYEAFCREEGLLSGDLVVFGCSLSLDDNLKYRLFYNNKRMQQPANYIGFYKDKAVQAIGVLEKRVYVDRTRNGLQVIGEGALTREEKTRIEGSMESAMDRHWDIRRGQCFFLAGSVETTLFKKTTRYPLRGNRKYFDLREVLALDAKEKLPDLPLLAQALRSRTW